MAHHGTHTCLFCGLRIFRATITTQRRDPWTGKPLDVELVSQGGHAPDCPYTVAEQRQRRRDWAKA